MMDFEEFDLRVGKQVKPERSCPMCGTLLVYRGVDHAGYDIFYCPRCIEEFPFGPDEAVL